MDRNYQALTSGFVRMLRKPKFKWPCIAVVPASFDVLSEVSGKRAQLLSTRVFALHIFVGILNRLPDPLPDLFPLRVGVLDVALVCGFPQLLLIELEQFTGFDRFPLVL